IVSDTTKLDETISKIFKKINNVKYFSPNTFMKNYKFQLVGIKTGKKKWGDPVGFCLAWCYWFIELILQNPDDEISVLIDEAYDKMKTQYPDIQEYIRYYANNLDQEKNKFMIEARIEKKNIYDENISEENIIKIIKHIDK